LSLTSGARIGSCEIVVLTWFAELNRLAPGKK